MLSSNSAATHHIRGLFSYGLRKTNRLRKANGRIVKYRTENPGAQSDYLTAKARRVLHTTPLTIS